jgi:hypothetical protein
MITDSIEKIPCTCGNEQEEVIRAQDNTRVGWWCPKCNGFTKAIGRERVWIAQRDSNCHDATYESGQKAMS